MILTNMRAIQKVTLIYFRQLMFERGRAHACEVVCQKADDSCFLGQERNADGGIHATRTTIMSEVCETGEKKLYRAIQNKWHGMLTSSLLVVLLHDNAHHMQLLALDALEHCGSISNGSCLTAFLTSLISLRATATCFLT
jgi:hypothetical protein